MATVSYQLRSQYVATYAGGSIAYGPNSLTFDVGAALTAGGGTITTSDAALAAVLDDYPPLFKSGSSGVLTPQIQSRLRSMSVGNAAITTETVFESHLNNEQFPRLKVLGDGTITTGNGTVDPVTPVGGSGTGIPATLLDAKGDIIAASAADTAAKLTVGVNGDVLTADSTAANGIKWQAPGTGTAILQTIVDVKGDLIAATASNTVARVPTGTVGQVLTVVPATASGLSWTDAAPLYNAVTFGGLVNSTVTDQTTEIAAFYAAIPNNSVAYFPAGTYIGLHAPGKQVTILGDGKHYTIFKSPTGPAALTKLVNFAASVKCAIVGVKLNANLEANVARGVNNEQNGGDKYLVVRDCSFENFTSTTGIAPHGSGAAGIYVWTADAVIVENNDFIDCIHSVFMDTPGPDCRVVNNRIWHTGAPGIGKSGIVLRRTTSAYCGALVEGNTVENIRSDPGALGVEGHCINIDKTQGVRVVNNATRDCATAGIHIGSGAYGAEVVGNNVSESGVAGHGGAIYVELNIGTTDTTVGTAGRRNGCTLTGNSIYNNSLYGVSLSYSSGTIMSSNVIFESGREGIFNDSDSCIFADNVLYNNNTLDLAASPSSTPNVQAQLRVTVGNNCTLDGNIVFDNQTVPTSDYGIAVADHTHILIGNKSAGVTAAFFESGVATNLALLNPSYNNDPQARLAKAANYTVTAADPGTLAITSTAAARTITLPAATVWRPGTQLKVKDESGAAATNNITITRAGTDTIDGANTLVINTNYGKATIYTDGVSKWFTV